MEFYKALEEDKNVGGVCGNLGVYRENSLGSDLTDLKYKKLLLEIENEKRLKAKKELKNIDSI